MPREGGDRETEPKGKEIKKERARMAQRKIMPRKRGSTERGRGEEWRKRDGDRVKVRASARERESEREESKF